MAYVWVEITKRIDAAWKWRWPEGAVAAPTYINHAQKVQR